MPGDTLTLYHVTRRFGARADAPAAVDDVTLEVGGGQLLALVGASGAGKTTVLRLAGGYERPDAGQVLLTGADTVAHDITALPPQARGFGMVFQHHALFPNLSVEENVAFGLEARGVARAERQTRAGDALLAVGLAGIGPRPVRSLSGAERQRVALARAVVIEPRVLLLDEPLAGLDPSLRREARTELRDLLRRLHITVLLATQDQDDAFALADRIAVFRAGRVMQVGTPEVLYHKPVSRGVAELVGHATILSCIDKGTHAAVTIGGIENRIAVDRPAGLFEPLADPVLVLRPEALALVSIEARDAWPGTIVGRRFTGGGYLYHVRTGDATIFEVASADGTPREGERVGVKVAREPVPMVPE